MNLGGEIWPNVCKVVIKRIRVRPELRGLPHKRVKPQLECLHRDTFSTAPGRTRDGLVATPRLPLQVPRGVQL